VQTFLLLVQELALGSMATIALLSLREIPGGFPSLIGHIAAASWAVGGVVCLRLPIGAGREAAPVLFGLAAASLVCARLFLNDRHRAGTILLGALVLVSGWALVENGARLAARFPAGALPLPLMAASLLGSALVLGSALAAMILGHWYLIPPPLPFTHLVRAASVFLAACVVRTIFFAASIVWLARGPDPAIDAAFGRLLRVDGDVVFFALRVFWGIIGPLVLAVLVLRTARMKSNQSATGLLYVSLVFVLVGELLANFLLVESRLPL